MNHAIYTWLDVLPDLDIKLDVIFSNIVLALAALDISLSRISALEKSGNSRHNTTQVSNAEWLFILLLLFVRLVRLNVSPDNSPTTYIHTSSYHYTKLPPTIQISNVYCLCWNNGSIVSVHWAFSEFVVKLVSFYNICAALLTCLEL